MKKTIAMLGVWMISMHSLAQNEPSYVPTGEDIIECPRFYLTLGSGLNSNFGIIGAGADIGLNDKIQVSMGVGIGTWGFKTGIEGRYFYSGCSEKGSALTVGFQRATGLPEFESDLEVAGGQTKTVKMKLNPQSNVQLSWYHAFRTSARTKFFIQAGYAFSITSGSSYEVLSSERLSDTSKTAMNLLVPGGLLLSFGFGAALD